MFCSWMDISFGRCNVVGGGWQSDPVHVLGELVCLHLLFICLSAWKLDKYNHSHLAKLIYIYLYVSRGTFKDTLQTTWPDLTHFQEAGGKIIHYHGESDFSIPTGSSLHYHESGRKIMYPRMSFNESSAALAEFYQRYLVPGAGHCSTSTAQPNGPFPQTNLAVLIDWVEKGNKPKTLNATILQGEHIGENQQICPWPTRPH